MTEQAVIRRSWLVVPPYDTALLDGVKGLAPDVVVLDLEYSVPPSRKAEARERVQEAIGGLARSGAEVFVRVDRSSWWCDLGCSVHQGLHGVVLPGAESPEQIREVDARLLELERERGVLEKGLELVPVLETAKGLWDAPRIASASDRISGVCLGRADLEMGLGPDLAGEIHLYPYLVQRVVMVAKALGVQPIGAWWLANSRGGVASPEETREAAMRGRRAGLSGCFCPRPEQVAAANTGFTPSQEEVERCQKVWEAFAQARSQGRGLATVDGRTYDLLKTEGARGTVAFAEACQKKDEEKARGLPPTCPERARKAEARAPRLTERGLVPLPGASAPGPSQGIKVRRSVMFVPVNNPRFVEKAWTRKADGLILDIEDAVPPQEKARARSLVREAISTVSRGGGEVYVRINQEYTEADLRGSIWPGLALVIIPKAEYAHEVKRVDAIITELERERGVPAGIVDITPNIESAVGVSNAYELATSSPRVKQMGSAGPYDFSLDLGIEMFAGFDQFFYARGECTLAVKAAGRNSTAGPYVPEGRGRVNDPEYALQYGKACLLAGVRSATGLHPAVVEPYNNGMTPSPEEVARAKKALEAFEELEERGEAMAVVDGRTIDIYEARRAQELVQWAGACATKDGKKARAVKRAEGGQA
ncbi:MAG: aldolase/citrate lyase family protein [Chloroflexota bacterium]|nr:aldolase/citrate lyase family protein [Chloroflexota bacterium]